MTIVYFSSPPGPSAITLVPLDRATITRCTLFQGTAPEISGKVLWWAQESDNQVYLAKPVLEGEGKWSLRKTIGSASGASQPWQIHVFFVSDEQSRFLSSLQGWSNAGQVGYYSTSQLPPGVTGLVTHTVVRDGTSNAPACEGA